MTENRKSIDEYPEMMTVDDLAHYFRVSKNTAYAFIKSGKIPSVKVGRQIRIYREDCRNLTKEKE